MAKLEQKYTEYRPTGYRAYYRVASIPAQIVVDAIRRGEQFITLCDHDESLKLSLTSARVQTYAKGVACVHCGMEGKYFAVERQRGDTKYHINVYHVDEKGKETMITSDHIHAKSTGGAHGPENRQPMCEPHNKLKSNFASIEEAIAAKKMPKPMSKQESKDVQKSLRRRVGMYDHALKMLQTGNTDHNWTEIMQKIDNGINQLLHKAFGIIAV